MGYLGGCMIIGLPISENKTQLVINKAYVDYIKSAGYDPFLITNKFSPETVVAICDGLLLPGGIDLDPIYYGYDNFSSFSVDPEKDEFERKLFYNFKDCGKPIFGICRGLQLIAREFILSRKIDGRIYFSSHIDKHNQTGSIELNRNVKSHWVKFNFQLYGKDCKKEQVMPVNSMHHQGVILQMYETKNKVRKKLDTSFSGFEALAWTDRGVDQKDWVVCEAFQIKHWGSPILAVQWHPEELMDTELIRGFFDANKMETLNDDYNVVLS
jgi:putative glutamine amidotransferase